MYVRKIDNPFLQPDTERRDVFGAHREVAARREFKHTVNRLESG